MDGQWYEKSYLILFFLCLICGFLFVILLVPYNDISEKINREYKTLASGHFFISFRKQKQYELRDRAKYKVGSRDKNYVFYQIASVALFISSLGFGFGLFFFIGSGVYENIILPSSNLDHEEVYSDDYVEDPYYEESYDEVPGTHHVDPHWVDGYTREDGTEVDGYWRGGDDGYERSNPDGDPSNNLDSYDYDSSPTYESDDGYDGIGAEIGEFLLGQ